MRKEINPEFINKNRVKTIKRKAKVIGEIIVESAVAQLQHQSTYATAAGIGLMQGLKYKGDFKAGAKAGLATVGVLVGLNIVGSVAQQTKRIKNA